MAHYTGTVAWVNNTKGYGFIGHEGHPDSFCDFKKERIEDRATLQEGDSVEFDIDEGMLGSQAVNVKRVK